MNQRHSVMDDWSGFFLLFVVVDVVVVFDVIKMLLLIAFI